MLKNGLILHLCVTLVWFLLMRGGVISLVIGWLIGWALLVLLRNFLGTQAYARRLNGFFAFLYILLRELILANIRLAIDIIITPRQEMRPDFLHYDISGLTDAEVFLLSQCITLTPGTTVVDLQGDQLLIHAFDASSPDQVRADIDTTLRHAITRFTR